MSVAQESRGITQAEYAGAVPVLFTNASPDPMCGLYMSADKEDAYGDNWLPAGGLAPGATLELKVKAGRYKARWDTCKTGATKPYYAATLWRESAVLVDQQTQLFAYVADTTAPTKRAATMGRDYRVVKFPGQAIDRNPRPQPPRPQPQQVALKASANEPPQMAGFIGRVPLSAEQVAELPPVFEPFDASEFVDPRAKLPRPQVAGAKPAMAGAKPAMAGPKAAPGQTAAVPGAPGATAKAAPAKPAPGPAMPQPSLNRKHELADSTIEFRKR